MTKLSLFFETGIMYVRMHAQVRLHINSCIYNYKRCI